MDATIDARQVERVLSHLARVQHRRTYGGMDGDDLRPSWLAFDAWEVILDDLETQRYRERARVAQLQLVR